MCAGELGGVRNFFFVHDADFTEVKQFVRDCDARWVRSWRVLVRNSCPRADVLPDNL